MKVFGLIGKKLAHSASKNFFEQKFRNEQLQGYRYELIELDKLDGFRTYIGGRQEIRGLNITLPYKSEIMAHLDGIHPEAASIGAVNVIKVLEGGFLKGYNTDSTAFARSISPYLKPRHQTALVLGTGGASRAACHALKALGLEFLTVSRAIGKGDLTYDELDSGILSRGTVIINTTPAGMFPDTATSPDIPYSLLNSGHILYDMVYNPTETLFLRKGRKQGATVVNGLKMLHLQAELSWNIWMADQD